MIDLSRFTVAGSDLDGVEVMCHHCAHMEPVRGDDEYSPTLADLVAWAETHEREAHPTITR